MGIFRIRCAEVDIYGGEHVELCVGDSVRLRHDEKAPSVPRFLDGEWARVVGFTSAGKVVATERHDLDSGFRRLNPDKHISEVRKLDEI